MQTENNSERFIVIQYLNEEVVEGFFIGCILIMQLACANQVGERVESFWQKNSVHYMTNVLQI